MDRHSWSFCDRLYIEKLVCRKMSFSASVFVCKQYISLVSAISYSSAHTNAELVLSFLFLFFSNKEDKSKTSFNFMGTLGLFQFSLGHQSAPQEAALLQSMGGLKMYYKHICSLLKSTRRALQAEAGASRRLLSVIRLL